MFTFFSGPHVGRPTVGTKFLFLLKYETIIRGGDNETVIWSAPCLMSDLFGKEELMLTLFPISALPCRMNQTSDSSQPDNYILLKITIKSIQLQYDHRKNTNLAVEYILSY